MIELIENADPGARIKVIGAGGCGGNAVNHMINAGLRGVDFYAVNTDAQALQNNRAPVCMQIGQMLTRGPLLLEGRAQLSDLPLGRCQLGLAGLTTPVRRRGGLLFQS